MDISDFIKEWTQARDLTPREVNSGKCEEFAQALEKHLPGSRMQYIEEFVPFESPAWPGGHIWVVHEDLLYDSESPTGVSHWSELPFYIRKQRQSEEDA